MALSKRFRSSYVLASTQLLSRSLCRATKPLTTYRHNLRPPVRARRQPHRHYIFMNVFNVKVCAIALAPWRRRKVFGFIEFNVNSTQLRLFGSFHATNPLTTAIILDRAALTTICVPHHSHRNGKGARADSKEHRDRGRGQSKEQSRTEREGEVVKDQFQT